MLSLSIQRRDTLAQFAAPSGRENVLSTREPRPWRVASCVLPPATQELARDLAAAFSSLIAQAALATEKST